MIEDIKQTFKSKLRKTMQQKIAAEISLEDVYPFDYFEYKVMLAAVFSKDNPEESLTTYLSELTFKNYFYQREQYQLSGFHEISKNIKELDGTQVEIENLIDFGGFPEFEYIGKNIIPDSFQTLSPAEMQAKIIGCSCKVKCTQLSDCCNKMKKHPFSYRRSDNGNWILKHAHANKIYECGPYCECDLRCANRLTQRPSTCQFVIFKTFGNKGWGVRTKNFIKRDTFLFQYCGEFIDGDEAEERNSKYVFEVQGDDGDHYNIDAFKFGNIARFVNHSCDPNTDIYKVNDCMSLPENM
jgi:histone-lysine N-methyltransferase SUV39H